ncbi:MAG: hypothetical protein RR068_13660 [Hafnia sp.]
MAIAANYTAHFHCDCEKCAAIKLGSPAFSEYVANSWAQCARAARYERWRISKDRTRCYAPGHKISRGKNQ